MGVGRCVHGSQGEIWIYILIFLISSLSCNLFLKKFQFLALFAKNFSGKCHKNARIINAHFQIKASYLLHKRLLYAVKTLLDVPF